MHRVAGLEPSDAAISRSAGHGTFVLCTSQQRAVAGNPLLGLTGLLEPQAHTWHQEKQGGELPILNVSFPSLTDPAAPGMRATKRLVLSGCATVHTGWTIRDHLVPAARHMTVTPLDN